LKKSSEGKFFSSKINMEGETVQSQRLDIVALQNPFLDPFSTPQGGIVAAPGQPLRRLQVPSIQTLVFKTTENTGNLAAVNVSDALVRAGITPRQPVLFRDETIGIELNLNLFGATPAVAETTSQVTAADIQTGQVVGRSIPTNFREARSVLHLITAQRTGSRNVAFNINELKRIARNLDLPANGNKDVLANRIRTSIIDFYNLPPQ
jgi:hypothetical protein